MPSKLSWRCATCGEVLTSWAASERHVDREHRAGRLDILGLGLLLADDSPLVPLTEKAE